MSVVVVVLMGCSDQSKECEGLVICDPEFGEQRAEFQQKAQDFLGTWQVYEFGQSPGFGYIIEEVPEYPLQILAFKANHQFVSNYEGLTDYKYFLIFEDPLQPGSQILALYTSLPEDTEEIKLENVEHSYNIVSTDEGLALWYRYCYEGCHIGVRRLI